MRSAGEWYTLRDVSGILGLTVPRTIEWLGEIGWILRTGMPYWGFMAIGDARRKGWAHTYQDAGEHASYVLIGPEGIGRLQAMLPPPPA